MKIALLTLGTRGDVQPYAVLGQALQRRGHEVVLSTARNFESLAKSYGIGFEPVDADFQALIDSEEGKKMMKNPFLARRNFDNWIYPMVRNALDTFYEVSKNSDKVLFHGKTLAGFFADQFPQKMLRANVVPAFEATTAFVNPVFSGLRLPPVLNKLSYKLTELSYKMMGKPIREFRANKGLSVKMADYKDLPSIYGISRYLLDEPKDFSDQSHFTGFWYNESPSELDADVVEFLQMGTPPLLLTFGSMPLHLKLNLQQAIIRMSDQLKSRIIIVKGWGFESTADLEQYDHIKVIQSAPYEKLLPMVRAVIHHGGVGTTAECLRAGKPFLACPVLYPLGDQYFWAQLAYNKGCALKPAPLKKLTENTFISKVNELLTTERLYEKAQEMRSLLEKEDGLLNAVKIIEDMP